MTKERLKGIAEMADRIDHGTVATMMRDCVVEIERRGELIGVLRSQKYRSEYHSDDCICVTCREADEVIRG